MKKSGYDREVGESGMPDRPPSVAELVFDNNPDLCAVYGIDGKIIDFNPSFAKAFLNFSDIEGRPPQPEEYNFFTFVDKEYLDILKELLNKLKPGEKLTQVVPKNIINEESGTGLRVIQWVTVTDGNGTYFTYGHDVTDDIRSEERKTLLSMRRVEDILHRRIDNLPIGYIEIKLLREDLTIEEQDIVVQAIDRLIELKLTQDPSYQDSLVQTERLLDPYLDVSMLYQNGMAERILGLTTQSREPNEVFDLQLTDGTSLAQYILDLLATSSSEALLKPLATRDYKYSDTDVELVVVSSISV